MASDSDSTLHLFVDANVLLSFFEYSDDDLNTIKTIIEGLRVERIVPYINRQLHHEVIRNREAKIVAALRKLNEQKLDLNFPTICKGFDEYDQLKDAQKNYSKRHQDLVRVLNKAIQNRKLLADAVLTDYFDSVAVAEINDDLHAKAMRRVESGNPPHKRDAIGDAIHWTWLLQVVPKGCDLHLVSMDRDYASEIDRNSIHPLLAWEWAKEKDSDVYLYRNLTSFFAAVLPEVRLPSDFRKNQLIEELLRSSSFARTHKAIDALKPIEIVDAVDADRILNGCLDNRQISWILSDPDVADYCRSLVDKFRNEIDAELANEIYDRSEPEEDETYYADSYDPWAEDD